MAIKTGAEIHDEISINFNQLNFESSKVLGISNNALRSRRYQSRRVSKQILI